MEKETNLDIFFNKYYDMFIKYTKKNNDPIKLKYGIKYIYNCSDEEYEDYFTSFCEKKLKLYLDLYFNSDKQYKYKCWDYLFLASKDLLNLPYIYKEENKNKEDKMYNDYVIIHYSNYLYDFLKDKIKLLTEDELIEFSYNYVINKYKNYKGKDNFRVNIFILISRIKEKIYDLDGFFILYFKHNGNQEKIIKYFKDKYKYLLNETKYMQNKKYLMQNFDDIIIDSLKSIYKYRENYEYNLIKVIDQYNNLYKSQNNLYNSKVIRKDISESEKEKIKEEYSYIKEKCFLKYKGLMEDDELRNLIDLKYNIYFDGYFKGNSNSIINKYLMTQLDCYFGRKMNNKETIEENKDLYDDIYNKYLYLYYKFLEKANKNISLKGASEVLFSTYENAIKKCLIKCVNDNKSIESQKRSIYFKMYYIYCKLLEDSNQENVKFVDEDTYTDKKKLK